MPSPWTIIGWLLLLVLVVAIFAALAVRSAAGQAVAGAVATGVRRGPIDATPREPPS